MGAFPRIKNNNKPCCEGVCTCIRGTVTHKTHPTPHTDDDALIDELLEKIKEGIEGYSGEGTTECLCCGCDIVALKNFFANKNQQIAENEEDIRLLTEEIGHLREELHQKDGSDPLQDNK